jgi:hypothetical protein
MAMLLIGLRERKVVLEDSSPGTSVAPGLAALSGQAMVRDRADFLPLPGWKSEELASDRQPPGGWSRTRGRCEASPAAMLRHNGTGMLSMMSRMT